MSIQQHVHNVTLIWDHLTIRTFLRGGLVMKVYITLTLSSSMWFATLAASNNSRPAFTKHISYLRPLWEAVFIERFPLPLPCHLTHFWFIFMLVAAWSDSHTSTMSMSPLIWDHLTIKTMLTAGLYREVSISPSLLSYPCVALMLVAALAASSSSIMPISPRLMASWRGVCPSEFTRFTLAFRSEIVQ